MKEFIEIPFGAKDSELGGWEYTIPEGFVVSIENGKIVVKKEESKNEKIRKEIINYFKCQSREEPSRKDTHNKWIAWLEKVIIPNHNDIDSSFIEDIKEVIADAPLLMQSDKEKMIAWLEKQGEQKTADKVEPKFKVGNWYQCTKDFFGKGVTFDKNTAYYCVKEGCLQDEYGCHIAIVKDLYDNFKLWTIQDAKDGDVLEFDCGIGIFKNLSDDGYNAHCYCYYDRNGQVETNDYSLYDVYEATPATKEQRDQLEKAMSDAGYRWNKEELKLERI